METINNVASGVSKAIWGESATTQNNETLGKEPLSGETGKGTVDSPYDQGNSETANNKPIGVYGESTNTNTTSTSTTGASSTLPTTTSTEGTASGLSDHKHTSTGLGENKHTSTGLSENKHTSTGALGEDKPTSSGALGENKLTSTSGVHDSTGGPDPTKPDPSKALENTDKTGVTSSTPGDPAKVSDISPSNAQTNTGAPTGGIQHQKQQGADRPLEEPTEKKATDSTGTSSKPNDSSGKSGDAAKNTLGTSEEHTGTGEQYVKTTGLAVDGGDFDATKPGAGHEAERLMDDKGIHHTDPTDKNPAPGPADEKKVSKVDKLKEKLHIGHKG